MARIKVPFTSITSQSNHNDGECKSIVNLRPKNGFLKPVPPRKVMQELSNGYDIIFVHRVGNDYESWIGVRNFNETAPYAMIYTSIKNQIPIHLGDTVGIINSVQQIGNTLSFVTDNDIYYVLYDNGSYNFMGVIPDCPNVEFSISASTAKTLKYTDEYNTPAPKVVYVNGVDVNNTEDTLVNMTKGLAEIIIDRNGGMFYDSFLIKWAYRLYDGSVIKHSSPILIMHREEYKKITYSYLEEPGTTSAYGNNSEVSINFFTLLASYDFSFLNNWKDVIKSVDFFVTKYVGLQSPESISKKFWASSYDKGGGVLVHSLYYPIFRNVGEEYSETPNEKIVNMSQFYHYYSEDNFGGPTTKTFPNADVTTGKNHDNIIFQDLLLDDSFSNHRYGAINSYSYNNRLRLIGLKTILYGGIPVKNYYLPYVFNGVEAPTPATPKTITMVVHIKTSDGTKYVKSVGDVGNIYLNPYISYPDPRAYKIDFVTYNPGDPNFPNTLVHTINLLPHPSMNIAYYLSDGLVPITFPSQNQTIPNFVPPDGVTYHNTIIEKNKLKVSEINNPFFFPNLNTYLIGSGEILAESSIIMNVSDRNYGMYPVFVFTTDGVFTMSGQTPDAVHDSVQAPTYLEPPITGVICATPYGVAFITKRGLMLISNYKTDFLSPQLREVDDILNIDLTGITSPLTAYPSMSFTNFLQLVTDMVYNPYDDELILAAKTLPYCYVYDFPSKAFYLSTEKIDQVVENTFPEVYIVAGTTLKDMSDTESNAASISIITRPLQFGTTDIKKLERIFLRALIYNAQGVSVAGFHSIDGDHFDPIKGFMFGTGGNYKDFDFGLMARETYRQYLFLLTGTIDAESQIQYVEYEIDQHYNNEKMR